MGRNRLSARWRNIFRCRPNSATRPSSCTPNQRPEANSWGALALLVSTSLLTPAAEAQEGGASFSVQAQSLSSALVDFAVQARVSIATPRAGLEAVRAAGLHGAYAPEDALRRLLAGTGFTFERLDAVTFRIVPASSPGTPAEIAPAPPKEVVVTATRRPQSLARMAGSVTVIDRTALRLSGARGASDLPADAAGLTVTNVGPGRNKLIVRGMSDGAFSGNAQSTVGIYFDESRLTYGAPDPDLLLSDVEAVRNPARTARHALRRRRNRRALSYRLARART
ncbi:MAG: secretin and TonB N-terminal domain-containing protein [Alphaproteobacteria bacterium]